MGVYPLGRHPPPGQTPPLPHSCYRLQTKFAKVMFSQVSVCPQEGSLSRGSLLGRPPYGNERAVRILLECMLVYPECYLYNVGWYYYCIIKNIFDAGKNLLGLTGCFLLIGRIRYIISSLPSIWNCSTYVSSQ